MATTRKLAELFRALAADDPGVAAEIAAQICENEEKKGHRSAARILRGALNASGRISRKADSIRGRESLNGAGIVSTALVRMSTDVKLVDVVLVASARKELERVIREWANREKLHQRGLAPRSKLLFYGPPGCGKSLTGRALAQELGIPIYLVRFDAVIGAYLGQTAIHLRQLFHFAETTPCVLLLDELDALGKQRGNPLDVGELDRIVIALMQELEHSQPRGLIIGTSNLPKHLDDALWRRFDLALAFKAPTRTALVAFARQLASTKGITLPTSVVNQVARERSFASAESLVLAEARDQALREG